MENKKIGYIENGIVIDHLPPRVVWSIARILGADKQELGRISLGDNYDSKKLGKKSFIKIEGRELSSYEVNLVALFAPEATISIIEGGKVKTKKKANIPETLENVVLCANPSCVTNDAHEKLNPRIYYRVGKFTCHYCGCRFSREELRIK